MDRTGLVVLLVALAATAGIAWRMRRSNRVREPAEPVEQDPAVDVLVGLGARPGEADLTVVQFSTAFCAPCRATRARVQQLQRSHPTLAYLHVDAESHLEQVRALDVRRTPTLFYLDRAGRLIGRSSGAPRPDELSALVEAYTGQDF